ncbi:MAG TPA: DegT/DnrJ/EryC1/StrS family aminotransferase [Roseiflexaceae bacterium]|nr:DegT/DnrJ/EryC1/StrS family aminotransferase [Roseiflexaceae bacterium]
MRQFIPVAEPALVGNERAYVIDCLDSTWISSRGAYIGRFERAFAEFCGARHAIACSSGTAALHLALLALGVGPGDEVIVPTLTYVATANAVVYCGARPVFVDSEPATWNIDPALLEARITPCTRGIVAVHLYGHPADMGAVVDIARRHQLFVVEDAAEGLGAEAHCRRVGMFGDLAAFSFYGNKIVTTGEGGMVICNDDLSAARVRRLKEQGITPGRPYWAEEIGYNYRMTNIAAAIGLAQIERVDWHLARRRANAALYRAALEGCAGLELVGEQPWARHAYWMNCVLLARDTPIERDALIAAMAMQGVETRPVFYPLHTLPIYRDADQERAFPVAEALAARGLNLPSSALLTAEEIAYVAETLLTLVEPQSRLLSRHRFS